MSNTVVRDEAREEQQFAVFNRLRERVDSYAKKDPIAWHTEMAAELALLQAVFDDLVVPTDLSCMQRVSVYEVSRGYGGPEEGGWWYDWYELVETTYANEETVELVKEELKAKYLDRQPERDRFSMANDGPEYFVVDEKYVGWMQTLERPRYE